MVCVTSLTMTYFLTGNPQYHWRGVVSRSCSGWEGVGPTRYGRQTLGVASTSFEDIEAHLEEVKFCLVVIVRREACCYLRL